MIRYNIITIKFLELVAALGADGIDILALNERILMCPETRKRSLGTTNVAHPKSC